jgi:hypothetical protein
MDLLRTSLHPTDLADLNAAARLRPAATVAEVAGLAVTAERYSRTVHCPPQFSRSLAVGTLATIRRLLNVEQQLAATRAAIAAHVAADDAGDDPIPTDLLDALAHAGCALDADELGTARTLHTATAVTW